MTTSALLQFLAETTSRIHLTGKTKRCVAEHTYIVGGAVRNYLLGITPKDIDIVVDSMGLGFDAHWLALQLQHLIPARTNLTHNQYGVAILTIASSWVLDGVDLKGEVLEIATARKESYGGLGGKGYKPHMVSPATIEEDVYRREFTVNTLLWRMGDIARHGVEEAPVLDFTGVGLKDLEDRTLTCPRDPLTTFMDDPTRMLRAVKFMIKYGFDLGFSERLAITGHCTKSLKSMPWDAVRKILVDDILKSKDPHKGVDILTSLNLDRVLREMLGGQKGFSAAVGRETKNLPIEVALRLALDSDWPIKHPLTFLDKSDQLHIYHRLLEARCEESKESLVRAIMHPPIDQQRVFRLCGLEGPDRAKVVQTARKLLVDWPLGADFDCLQEQVENLLGAQ